MARNRSSYKRNREQFESHETCPTGALLQQVIFEPQCNTWFERVRVDETEENCYFDHPCIFILLPARPAIPKVKKVSGKGTHRQLPKRYLEQQALPDKPKDNALGR